MSKRPITPEEYAARSVAREMLRRACPTPDFEQMRRDRELAERLRPANLLNGLAIGGIVAPPIGFIALAALLMALVT